MHVYTHPSVHEIKFSLALTTVWTLKNKNKPQLCEHAITNNVVFNQLGCQPGPTQTGLSTRSNTNRAVNQVQHKPGCQPGPTQTGLSTRSNTNRAVNQVQHKPGCQPGPTQTGLSTRSNTNWAVNQVQHKLGCMTTEKD